MVISIFNSIWVWPYRGHFDLNIMGCLGKEANSKLI